MRKLVIMLSIPVIVAGSCRQANSQTSNTDNIMENDTQWYEQDKLDIEKFLENAEERVHVTMDPVSTFYWFMKEFPDGRKVEISGREDYGFQRVETLPLPHFYEIYTSFYKNGNMERKGMKLIRGIYIGVFEYYDENGNKVYETNLDEVYSDFDYNKFLKVLHNERIINLETGENRDKITWIGYDGANKIWTVVVYDETVGGAISYQIDHKTSPETVRKTINKY